MAITKSANSGRQAIWYELVWSNPGNNEKSDRVVPNLRQYDKETGETTYFLQPGERPGINIAGKLSHATVFARPGFNDRQKNKAIANREDWEKNQYDLLLSIDSGEDQLINITAKLVSDENVPDRNTMDLLNRVASMAEQGHKDSDITIGLYKKNNGYPGTSIHLAVGKDEEGKPVFDFKNRDTFVSIQPEHYSPQPEPVMNNGRPVMSGNRPVMDMQPVLDWVSSRIQDLVNQFPTADQKQTQENIEAASADALAPSEADEDVSVGEALGEDQQEATFNRPRMAG